MYARIPRGAARGRPFAHVCKYVCMFVGYVFRYHHSDVYQIGIDYRVRYVYEHTEVFQEHNPVLLSFNPELICSYTTFTVCNVEASYLKKIQFLFICKTT